MLSSKARGDDGRHDMLRLELSDFDLLATDFATTTRLIMRRATRDRMREAMCADLDLDSDTCSDRMARQTLGVLLAERFPDELGLMDHPEEGAAIIRRVRAWRDLERTSPTPTPAQRLRSMTDAWLAFDAWKRKDLPHTRDGIAAALRAHRYHVQRLEASTTTSDDDVAEARRHLAEVEISARAVGLE